MLLGLLCAATPVATGPKLAPGSLALGLLDTEARGKNVSSDQRSPQLQRAIAASLAAIAAPTSGSSIAALAATEAPATATHPAIQQQQANTRGENVSSGQQTPLQRAIAASLAAIKAPTSASDRAAPAAAGTLPAAAAMSSSSAIPPSPAPRLPIPASVRVADLNARTAEGAPPVGVNETGSTVEHVILGLLFLGIGFFIIDCCGPELSRMFGCRGRRRWSATKGVGGG